MFNFRAVVLTLTRIDLGYLQWNQENFRYTQKEMGIDKSECYVVVERVSIQGLGRSAGEIVQPYSAPLRMHFPSKMHSTMRLSANRGFMTSGSA